MSGKDLKDKAIKIQGKDYVLVSDRIIYFNEEYPEGSIVTELVSPVDSEIVVVKATVYPHVFVVNDNQPEGGELERQAYHRKFTGYSQAVKGAGFINKTAALENAETSAVGRALAMMGIGVIDSIASVDEINKAKGTDPQGTLDTIKQEVFAEFKKQGIDDTQEMMNVIDKAINKASIRTVEDGQKVLKYLKELA